MHNDNPQPSQIDEKSLKSFFQSAPMMMGIVDLNVTDFIYVAVNPAVAKFLEVSESELPGKSLADLGMNHETIQDWIGFYKTALENRTPQKVGYWHQSKHGKRFLSGKINFIEFAGSGLPRFSFIIQDATDSKLIEEELRRQEEFLETVLDNIPDMIFVKEAKNLRFLKFNKAGEDLIGYARSDLMGKNDYDFFPKDQADHFTSMDRKVFQKHEVVEIQQEPIETRLKGTRILHTKKIPLFDSKDEPLYLVGISEDITEKLQAEEMRQKVYHEQVARQEVEKLLEARDEFISIASHELKSPLSSLILQAQMFRRNIELGKEDALSKEKINQLLEMTEKQVQRLDRLVNDMLDVSRIRTGKLSIDRTEFNLFDLVKDVMTRMKDQFLLTTGREPKFTYATDKIVGNWDQLRIEQVILNLLTNAIRYGSRKPVEIRLSRDENIARISVHDEGIGIAEEHLEKIFDRFVRAINPSEVSGLGLGLFISKQIVKAHGGNIWAESKVGTGSTFIVELPIK